MPNKSRSKDSKASSDKRSLNASGGASGGPKKPATGAMSFKNPSGLVNESDPDDKIGQFTGRGSPGLQKK